jgi:3-oxoacyl-[acyl-carrier protein] reductase
MKRLEGKVALVTGAGRGFGRAIALSYAYEGAELVAVARTVSELEDLAGLIRSRKGKVSVISADLTEVSEIYRIRDEVLARYGKLDVLVNNAAHNPRRTLEEMTVGVWDRTIALNLRAPFLLTKSFFDTMKNQGKGSIINLSSKSAEIGFVGEIVYCPSKYGIEGLTQCLALELKPYNIAVNSLQVSAPTGKTLKPGGITLEQLRVMPNDEREKYGDDNSMVEAFADAWVFLALQDSSRVTGQRFVTKELAEYLQQNSWEEATRKWGQKLLKSVYTPFDFPKSVIYNTPENIWKELKFN